MLTLPIDPLLPELVATLEAERPGGSTVVLEAPPGAGKTTRAPRALLDARFARSGEILVLQPRRLPARLAAERVAAELGEPLGRRVGYTVRFDEIGGPETRLRFITEGVLLRRLLRDPTLGGVAAVVLDELHERHLASDVALAWLHQLQRTLRPDLRLCVMSATVETAALRAYLNDCPVLRSEGRRFPVTIDHLPQPDDRRLDELVLATLRRVAADTAQRDAPGDVLVFLPGRGEIRACLAALGPLAERHRWLLRPLHGELSPAEQDRAIRPAPQRKVILSTNVAETSVTIEGVTLVIDSGLARVASHSPWSGLPTLKLAKISQAAALQRAGRAGRTQPGRALRLYTRHDLDNRRPFELPEVERLDLAEPLLLLAALGVHRPADWSWVQRPPEAALTAASELLGRLGAVDGRGQVTALGRQLLRFPVHPRLGRLIVEGERRGAGPEAAALAALLSERPFPPPPRVHQERTREPLTGDLLERLDLYQQARRSRFSPGHLRTLGLERRAVDAVEQVRHQLERELRRRGTSTTEVPGAAPPRPVHGDDLDRALALATIAALPERVARRRGGPVGGEVLLAGGGAAAIGPTPASEWVVAVEVDERPTGPRGAQASVVSSAVAISPELLLEVRSDDVVATEELRFTPATERVEQHSRLSYGALTLEEERRIAPPSEAASAVLAQAARAVDAARWVAPEVLEELAARLQLLAATHPQLEVPRLDGDQRTALLTTACSGRTSFAELRAADLAAEWLAVAPDAVRGLLRREAPLTVRLPSGRELRVHYEAARPPWVASRLQDFFGQEQGPAVCGGRVPLTLHLLAPNQRPVQVTQDLRSFWRQHYPAIRRELSRRYPRHAWPEDGATAGPTAAPPARRSSPR